MKTLKAIMTLAGVTVLIGTTGVMSGCKHMDSEEHHNMQAHNYTCRMHPEVVQNSPGKCPKCGMELVPKD